MAEFSENPPVVNGADWNALLDHGLVKAAKFVVYRSGGITYVIDGLDGKIEDQNATSAVAIQAVLDAMGSGSVFIHAGAYGVTALTVKTGQRVIIDKGATAFTISIDAGATCYIEDYNAGVLQYYEVGSLTTEFDLTADLWMSKDYSYTMRMNGAVCEVCDRTGALLFSDANAKTVFDSVVAMLVSGDSIFFRAGTYPFTMAAAGDIFNTSTLENIVMIGENRDETILRLLPEDGGMTGVGGPMYNFLRIEGATGTTLGGWFIGNLTFDANKNGYHISCWNMSDFTIVNCRFMNAKQYIGIYINSFGAIEPDNAKTIRVVDCIIERQHMGGDVLTPITWDMFGGGGVSNMIVRGCTFIDSGATPGDTRGAALTSDRDTQHMGIYECWFEDVGLAIAMDAGTDFEVRGCWIQSDREGFMAYGNALGESINNCKIEGNYFICGKSAIWWDDTRTWEGEDIIICNNHIYVGTVEPAVTIKVNSHNLKIEGNYIENTGAGAGVWLNPATNADNISVLDNTIITAGAYGIQVVDVTTNLSIVGNTLNSLYGIRVTNAIDPAVVGNKIVVTGDYCVRVDTNNTNVTIVGNSCVGSTVYAISLDATTIVASLFGNTFNIAAGGKIHSDAIGLEQTTVSESYVVFKNGLYTYAYNGINGLVDSYDLDSGVVIQYVLDALSVAGGGKIAIKEGVYAILTALDLYDNVTIEGSGFSTELAGSGAYTVVDLDTIGRVKLANLTVSNGVAAGSICISIERGVRVELNNVWTVGGEIGLYIHSPVANPDSYVKCIQTQHTAATEGVVVEEGLNIVQFTDVTVVGCTTCGVRLDTLTGGVCDIIGFNGQNTGANNTVLITDCVNTSVKITGGGIYGAEIVGMEILNSTCVVGIANFVVVSSEEEGVVVDTSGDVQFANVRIGNCSLAGVGLHAGLDVNASTNGVYSGIKITGVNHSVDIYEHGGSSDNVFIGDFNTCTLATGGRSRVFSTSYKSAAKGIFSFGAAVVTSDVDHGLGYIPNISDFNIVPLNDMGLATKFWASAVTAAKFRVTLDAAPGAGSAADFAWTYNKSIQ